ncbi:MAG: LysR family transcriptional regulator [Xanthobacteraceae bacterium]|nr:LysR family transcriptional regulator [Xanthobacteraceae bacterium]
MDLRQARTFVAVAELGTISRAAQSLRIAQPALSRQIRNLEEELGLTLFDRAGGRLRLTSQGEQLLGDCRDLLNHANAVRERAQLLRHEESGVLKVAAAPGNIESLFADFLHRYARRFPKVQVRLIDAHGPEMLGMLERGEISLGQSLIHALQPDDRRFASHPLGSIDILAASKPSVALGKGSSIEIAQLAPHPLLLLSSDFVLRRTFDAACRLAGLKPKIVLESRDPRTLLAMAEAGHGVSIIPSVLRTHSYSLRIVAVTYRGKRLREPSIILWDRRRPRPRYAIAFCEMLAEYAREIFPITRPTNSSRC